MANFIESSASLLSPATPAEGEALVRRIEESARISHRSEDQATEGSWRRFVTFVVLERGDWSVTEHVSASAIFRISRGISHELVRHRLFSYTQESTRFVNYAKRDADGKLVHQMEFIMPGEFLAGQLGADSEAAKDYMEGCIDAENRYVRQIERGVKAQIARDGLPIGLATTIIVTGNLRSWHHFLSIRTTRETHPDFRKVTIPLLGQFRERIPVLFDAITPERKQSEAMAVNR